ncbi:hypothetical protein [Mycobacterium asiaticum]|uniref:hypothetical protein n=1 Tax=Mycobacterium asiaticum TaxID=1790 RepID=UPI0012DB5E9B|nr:hypothetical protein [Mycobacterium asiaticum]
MLRRFRNVYVIGLAYVALLMALAFLGGLVASLAAGSELAIAAAVGLIACLWGAVAGFRAGSRKLDQSPSVGDSINNTSIFAAPMHRDEVERYLNTYRGKRADRRTNQDMALLKGSRKPRQKGQHALWPDHAASVAVPTKLSA